MQAPPGGRMLLTVETRENCRVRRTAPSYARAPPRARRAGRRKRPPARQGLPHESLRASVHPGAHELLGVPVERDDVLASMNGDRGELGSKPVEFGLERLPTRPVDRQVISPHSDHRRQRVLHADQPPLLTHRSHVSRARNVGGPGQAVSS
jgi:hypothetical protein